MNPDSDSPRLSDISAAIGLLTRLPLPMGQHDDGSRGARAAWAWPLAGALVGVLAGAVGWFASLIGFTAPVVAGLALAAGAALTGALHEDGLADTADGFWGGSTPERRLTIMKDSQIGTFGTLALILSVGLRWSALSTLFAFGGGWGFGAMIAAGALSRVPMAALSHLMAPARPGGLSAQVGKVSQTGVALATLAATLIAIPAAGGAAFAGLVLVTLTTVALMRVARRKIGGQTGDVLGAGQQLAEIVALAAFAAVATS